MIFGANRVLIKLMQELQLARIHADMVGIGRKNFNEAWEKETERAAWGGRAPRAPKAVLEDVLSGLNCRCTLREEIENERG